MQLQTLQNVGDFILFYYDIHHYHIIPILIFIFVLLFFMYVFFGEGSGRGGFCFGNGNNAVCRMQYADYRLHTSSDGRR